MRWQVPLIGQTTIKTCWEACGHMMWLFRYPGDEAGYRRQGGPTLTNMAGLSIPNTDTFYRSLGMQGSQHADLGFIDHQLELGPMIVLLGLTQGYVHAEVLVGLQNRRYILNNPQGVARISFNDEVDSTDTADPAQDATVQTCRASRFKEPWVWWWPHRHEKHRDKRR